MLIAPAGYGKTHTITQCLEHTEGRQLILTHTHAGVASILEKIKKANIASHKFHVETITGYAQKYLEAYYTKNDIPSQEDTKAYYPFLVEKVTSIIALPIIIKIISETYSGLFVDEYQDCTLLQHNFIKVLSCILPTRILGDHLQGIFNFDSSLSMVDLIDETHMGDFRKNIYELDEPWRWKGVNEPLGKSLKEIRNDIELQKSINLKNHSSITFIQIESDSDIYNPTKKYNKDLNKILSEKNLLIIHPESSNINQRKNVIKSFKIPITLLEAIDDKDFYKLSKKFDDIKSSTLESVIHATGVALFNKTEIEKWISPKGVKNRTGVWKIKAQVIKEMFEQANKSNPLLNSSKIIRYLSKIDGIKCYRKELLSSLCSALEDSDENINSVYDSMVIKRNHVRKIGRKIYGRCIGTTLLTKGLEFQTVVILNAHKFECPKNLYVALTRASKKLIIFGTSSVLSPKY